MSREYSECVVLVFTKPSIDDLNESERTILNGLRAKWAEKHNDFDHERINIIFVDEEDIINCLGDEQKKYSVLKKLGRNSLLYIIGHSGVGSDYIFSDHDAYIEGSAAFHFQEIAFFLRRYLHIKNDVLYNYPLKKAFPWVGQNLRIVVGGCYSGVQDEEQASFAEKLLMALFVDAEVSCEVVGQNGLLFPIGSKPSFKECIKFSLNYLTEKMMGCYSNGFFNIEPGFHKRRYDIRGKNGESYLKNKFPYHKGGDDYKTIFTLIRKDDSVVVQRLNVSEA